jgi:catechol 2,3-dioxygenase-like lactoylglutathione lyase family enzyme
MHSEINVTVASCVVRVTDLDRSVDFYRDIFSCRVAVQSDDMALLLTSKGFQIYLHVKEPFLARNFGRAGRPAPGVVDRQ